MYRRPHRDHRQRRSYGAVADRRRDGRYVEFHVDAPIGVAREARYPKAPSRCRANATLVAFTDGLVERRGEVLDVGLARLRDAATGPLALDDLLAARARARLRGPPRRHGYCGDPMAELEGDGRRRGVDRDAGRSERRALVTPCRAISTSQTRVRWRRSSLPRSRRSAPTALIFDLSGLRFMDSAGIAVLIGAAASQRSCIYATPRRRAARGRADRTRAFCRSSRDQSLGFRCRPEAVTAARRSCGMCWASHARDRGGRRADGWSWPPTASAREHRFELASTRPADPRRGARHRAGRPTLRSPTVLEPSGRGLRIVEALSKAWGVVPGEGGTRVWFTLAGETTCAKPVHRCAVRDD